MSSNPTYDDLNPDNFMMSESLNNRLNPDSIDSSTLLPVTYGKYTCEIKFLTHTLTGDVRQLSSTPKKTSISILLSTGEAIDILKDSDLASIKFFDVSGGVIYFREWDDPQMPAVTCNMSPPEETYIVTMVIDEEQ